MRIEKFIALYALEDGKLGKLCRALQSDRYIKGSNSDKLAIISTYKLRYGREVIDEFFKTLKSVENER